jgi:hypothetical protein
MFLRLSYQDNISRSLPGGFRLEDHISQKELYEIYPPGTVIAIVQGESSEGIIPHRQKMTDDGNDDAGVTERDWEMRTSVQMSQLN